MAAFLSVSLMAEKNNHRFFKNKDVLSRVTLLFKCWHLSINSIFYFVYSPNKINSKSTFNVFLSIPYWCYLPVGFASIY